MPTTVIDDSFARANTSNGAVGNGWVDPLSAYSVQGGQLRATTTGSNPYINEPLYQPGPVCNGSSGVSIPALTANELGGSYQTWAVCRRQSNGNAYGVQFTTAASGYNGVAVYKFVGGSASAIGGLTAYAAVAGHAYSLTTSLSTSGGTTTIAWTLADLTAGTTAASGSQPDAEASLQGVGTWGVSINDGGSPPLVHSFSRVVITSSDGTSTPTPTPTPTVTLTPTAANFWDNGYNGSVGGAVQTSGLARLVVTTDATTVTASVYADIYGNQPAQAIVGVRVNGTTETQLTCTAVSGNTFTVPLPGAAATRVEFVAGNQQVLTSGSGWYGSYFTGLSFAGGTSAAFVAPAPANTLLVYGDSIEGGGANANVPFGAWTELLRGQWAGDVQLEAYGGRTLYDDCATPAATTAFAAHLAAQGPAKLICCIGVNDYSNGQWSLAAFAAGYGSLVDQFHALAPAVPVAVVSPLLTTAREGPNGAGVTLGQYRAAVLALAAGRSWLTVVDGSRVLAAADLNSDGVHPTIAGQAKLVLFYLGVANAITLSSVGPTAADNAAATLAALAPLAAQVDALSTAVAVGVKVSIGTGSGQFNLSGGAMFLAPQSVKVTNTDSTPNSDTVQIAIP